MVRYGTFKSSAVWTCVIGSAQFIVVWCSSVKHITILLVTDRCSSGFDVLWLHSDLAQICPARYGLLWFTLVLFWPCSVLALFCLVYYQIGLGLRWLRCFALGSVRFRSFPSSAQLLSSIMVRCFLPVLICTNWCVRASRILNGVSCLLHLSYSKGWRRRLFTDVGLHAAIVGSSMELCGSEKTLDSMLDSIFPNSARSVESILEDFVRVLSTNISYIGQSSSIWVPGRAFSWM